MNRSSHLAAPPIALALLGLTVSAGAAAPPAKLVVEVSGFHSDSGQLLLRLYGSEAGFPTDGSRALRQVTQPIREGRAVVELAGLPFGSYAIGCVHDENGNGKLDANLLGIPKEGVCASNDARGHRGPPSWNDARFDFKADGTRLPIRVRY
jgi:uncharacterized protein (DUF2141 family)